MNQQSKDKLDAIITATAAIDMIDKHECKQEIIAGAVCSLLLQFGYSEEEAYASAALTLGELGDKFKREYWKSDGIGNKINIYIATVRTAAKRIEDGNIDEETKRLTRQALTRPKSDDVRPATD